MTLLGSLTYETFANLAEDSGPAGLTFSPDGTRMYMVGIGGDRVYSYTLSTPFVVTSRTYDGVSFAVSGEGSNPRGIAFKPDGTKMYLALESGLTPGNGGIYQYSLSSPWNLSPAPTYDTKRIVTGSNPVAFGLAMKSDGTKVFVCDPSFVKPYTLSTPWDLSTSSGGTNFSTTGQESNMTGISLNDAGTIMVGVGSGNDDLYEYALSTGWDLSTASYVTNLDIGSLDAIPDDVYLAPTKLYIVHRSANDRVHQWGFPTGRGLVLGSLALN